MTVLQKGAGMLSPAGAFQAHARQVHAFLWRRAGQEIADDLLGEVFAVAVARWESYDSTLGAELPWLYGIAHRVLGAEHRARARQALLVDALSRHSQEPAHDWDAVDSRLDADRLRHSLSAGLASLPEDERDVLLLVAWEHLTPTEAASALGIPAGTARSRLHRARRTLRVYLESS